LVLESKSVKKLSGNVFPSGCYNHFMPAPAESRNDIPEKMRMRRMSYVY